MEGIFSSQTPTSKARLNPKLGPVVVAVTLCTLKVNFRDNWKSYGSEAAFTGLAGFRDVIDQTHTEELN